MELEGKTIVITTQNDLTRIISESLCLGLEEIRKSISPDTHKSQEKKLLDAKDVAREFGIGVRMLERWRMEGIGPAYTTVGRRIFYERSILEGFFAAGRVQTTGMAEK